MWFGAAAQATTLFVGPTFGSNTGCTSTGFTSVQAAVDAAAPGDTVYLCGTVPFAEQVIITKVLTLTGDDGATIQAPSPFPTTDLSKLPPQFTTDDLFIPQAIVIVWGAGANATITNLIITGPLPGNGGCASQEFGVVVIAGAKVSLISDEILNIADENSSLYGCQTGVGVLIGREYWPNADYSNFLVVNFVGYGTMTGTEVSGYMKGGIVIDGPGSNAVVRGNKVTGSDRDTLFSPIVAQNGIQVSRGASAQVRDNTVSGNTYTGSAYASSGGILIFGGCGDPLVTGVQVMGNTLTDNDVGIYLNNYDDTCSTASSVMTNNKAVNNTLSNGEITNVGSGVPFGFPYAGYQAGIDDVGTNDKVINNTIAGFGYTPAQTTGPGTYVIPIDTLTVPTNQAKVHANKVQ
ncbi:MAG TPA: right-handed parallel beta-helix repeat-containing protein [Terriglobia bacterium]|nr:right-handed parallel beta-helix repeat-containing protein [Terriglobia bacterium]